MTEQQFSLSHFYKGWDVYQQHLVTAIAPLTAEQLTLRSSQHHWSVGMIANAYCGDTRRVVPHADGRGR
jgi:hypothetical protein